MTVPDFNRGGWAAATAAHANRRKMCRARTVFLYHSAPQPLSRCERKGPMAVASGSVLTESLLQACRQRAAGYDRDNRFCQEDFDELKAAGYLKMAVPREFGGFGMKLADVAQETRRLATYAAPTALCINMHNYWVGLTADHGRSGDKSIEWLLQEAGAGEVFAAGHAETGNDLPLLLSTTKAERVSGGYKFTGRKAFGSLTPVWTRLGVHGMDTSDP